MGRYSPIYILFWKRRIYFPTSFWSFKKILFHPKFVTRQLLVWIIKILKPSNEIRTAENKKRCHPKCSLFLRKILQFCGAILWGTLTWNNLFMSFEVTFHQKLKQQSTKLERTKNRIEDTTYFFIRLLIEKRSYVLTCRNEKKNYVNQWPESGDIFMQNGAHFFQKLLIYDPAKRIRVQRGFALFLFWRYELGR